MCLGPKIKTPAPIVPAEAPEPAELKEQTTADNTARRRKTKDKVGLQQHRNDLMLPAPLANPSPFLRSLS